jgi:hypothetical protein
VCTPRTLPAPSNRTTGGPANATMRTSSCTIA